MVYCLTSILILYSIVGYQPLIVQVILWHNLSAGGPVGLLWLLVVLLGLLFNI